MAVITPEGCEPVNDNESKQSRLDKELCYAVMMSDINRLIKGIEAGGNVNALHLANSRTLLQTSIEVADDINILAVLLVNDADVLQKGFYGSDALMTAAKEGCDASINLLMRFGADINSSDNYGITPLMRATIYYNESSVRTLLGHGADIMMRNNDGKTAIDIAKEKGLPEIVEILEQGLKNNIFPELEVKLLKMSDKDIENSANKSFLEKFIEIDCLDMAFTNLSPACQASLLMVFLPEITSNEGLYAKIQETMKKTWAEHNRSIENSIIAKFLDFGNVKS